MRGRRFARVRGAIGRRLSHQSLEDRRVLASYWVSPSGSNGQAGSESQPWATLQHAANLVTAGDTVHVLPGSYQGFDLRADGTASNPIRFLAEPGAIVDRDNARTIDGINLEGADHVVIDGFEITGATRAGIRSVVNHHVTLTNNHAHDNGRWGIFTGFSDDLLIEGNTTTNSAIEHGIYVSNSADRPVIRENVIYGNRSNGIHLNGDASLGGDGLIEEALIERNIIFDNGTGGGSGINGDGLVNSVIRNNMIYNTHASGISLYRIDGGAPATGNLVVGNTVVVASDGRWAMNIQNGSTGNTLLNNIFYSHHSFRGAIDISADSLPGTVSDYNAIENRITTNGGNSLQTLSQWQASTGHDTHSIVATPSELFVDPAGGDYHLRVDSPAINAGTTVDLLIDFEGDTRPMGSSYDMGADEFREVTAAATVSNRRLFYNDSTFDAGDPAANANDEQAIATDKVALLAGQSASFDNYSSYVHGVNGIMFDLVGRIGSEPLAAADFTFRTGNTNDTDSWQLAPLPMSIITRVGAGASGSDRVHLTWENGAIVGSWLEVVVLANDRTELASNDRFYFGNAIAETGNSPNQAIVDASDFVGVRGNQRSLLDPAAVDNAFDFNRDRVIDSADLLLVRDHATSLETSLRLISPVGDSSLKLVGRTNTSPLREQGHSSLPEEERPIARNHRLPLLARRASVERSQSTASLDRAEPQVESRFDHLFATYPVGLVSEASSMQPLTTNRSDSEPLLDAVLSDDASSG